MLSRKIGLIDVDGHNYPNLALMKLSAYHKMQGDMVEWYDTFTHYDVVYMAKVFAFTPDYGYVVNADKVVKGGTGYAISGAGGESYCKEKDPCLPDEVEHIMPDYSLYGIKDTAYGYLTRGCPRGCDFCIVAKKEGKCSHKVANLAEFWSGQKNIVLNDPNILACKDWKESLQQLIDSKAWVDFNQGLDARMLTEEKIMMLTAVKIKEIHFAWDRYEDKDIILPKLKLYALLAKKRPHAHNSIVYVLVNHTSTVEQDLERIYTLRELGYWAYVMVYDKQNAEPVYHDMQRWCNNRFIFAKCNKFEDYKTLFSADEGKGQLSLF